MKRSVKILIIGLIFCLVFAGCDYDDPKYPQVRYYQTGWGSETYDKTIPVREGHVLDIEFPWATIDTDDGYYLVLHFAKEQ